MSSIKFKSFSSGSCGNCYYLGIFNDEGKSECGIIIDTGVSPRRLKKELAQHGLSFDDFNAVLITHDHYDHIRSLGSFCKHIAKPVWATPVLLKALLNKFITGEYLHTCKACLAEGWNEIVPGRIRVHYFVVPHDANQTVGYAIELDGYRFVIMTDIGAMTTEALNFSSQADTVVIESNYDREMLAKGPYPEDLQRRIRGGHGHLSNDECAEAIRTFYHDSLTNIFLCHLSEHNNTPQLAHAASAGVLAELQKGSDRRPVRLVPLPRQTASVLFEL